MSRSEFYDLSSSSLRILKKVQYRPRAAYFSFTLHLTRVVQFGVFSMKSEHIVVSSWLRNRCYISCSCWFLPEYLFPYGSQPREVFSITCFGSPPAVRVEEDASNYLNPSLNGTNKCNMVSSTSFSRSKFPLVCENSVDGTALLFANCYHREKVLDAAFDHFLTIWNLDVSPRGHEKEKLSSLHSLPNDSTDGESSTKRVHR